MGVTVSKYTALPLCCSFLLTLLPCSWVGSSAQAAFPSENVHLLWQGMLHGLWCGYLLHRGASSPPPLALVFPLPLLTLFVPSSSAWVVFSALSYMLSLRHYYLGISSSAVPYGGSAGADCNWLHPAWDSPSLVSQRPPCRPPRLPIPPPSCQVPGTCTQNGVGGEVYFKKPWHNVKSLVLRGFH